jgi:exonuclease III
VRIVVWNCRMALGKKRKLLYQLRPQIAVIPECSRDSMLECKADGFDTCWWGANRHKGLGVIAAKPWALEPGSAPGDKLRPARPRRVQPQQKWIAPVRVHGPCDFLLLCVWACPVGREREKNYVGQTYEAVIRHPDWFTRDIPTVICGDFNSNTIFDPGRKVRKHSTVVQLLSDRGLRSAYHAFFSEDHGKETRPTYYFWHRKERGFHIDYIFVPQGWMEHVSDFRIGTYHKWRAASDHMPIFADIAMDLTGTSEGESVLLGDPLSHPAHY